MWLDVENIYTSIVAEGPELSGLIEMLTFEIDGETVSLIDQDNRILTGVVYQVLNNIKDDLDDDNLNDLLAPAVNAKDAFSIPVDYLDEINLRDYQLATIAKSLVKGRGIIELATGAGKTEIAVCILKFLFEFNFISKAFVLTDSLFLMTQFYDRLRLRLNSSDITIGRLGGEFSEIDVDVLVGTSDSLWRGLKKPPIRKFIKNADAFIADEAHHISSATWKNICISAENARFRYGLTPSICEDPFVIGFQDYVVVGLTGPIIASIPANWLASNGYLATQYVTFIQIDKPKISYTRDWHKIYYNGVVNHETRNLEILKCAKQMYALGHKCLIFISRKEHGWRLLEYFNQLGLSDNVYFARGGNKIDNIENGGCITRILNMSELSKFLDSKDRFILIGSTVTDEGVDLPFVNCLIFGTGMKKFRRVLQRLGRGMRPKVGGNRVFTFDFWDNHQGVLLNHSKKRLEVYRYEGHNVMFGLDFMKDEFKCTFDSVNVNMLDYARGYSLPAEERGK